MSNKKLSGAQLRKRKREQEADAKKYGLFMQQFLKQRPAEDDDSDESDMDKLGQEAVTVTDPPECLPVIPQMIFDSTVPHWQTFMKLILMELNCLQKSVTAICC
jgi:hypothetical protein